VLPIPGICMVRFFRSVGNARRTALSKAEKL
jgi:hypothetical protein